MAINSRSVNRIWFDTEFYDNGKTIDLISIGMVKANGRTLYLESSDADLENVSDWIKENVCPRLLGKDQKSNKEIADIIMDFAGLRPEFISYYCSYDWVVLCQLYGSMTQLPKGWPMFCVDIKQISYLQGDFRLLPNLAAHNALDDALWAKRAWEQLYNEGYIK